MGQSEGTEESDVVKFLWSSVVYRFKALDTLIMDSGPQFDNVQVRKFCRNLKIRQIFMSRSYPPGNCQAKSINKTLVTLLKKEIDAKKGKLVYFLEEILWAY